MLRLRLGFAKRWQQQRRSEKASKMMRMVRQNTAPLVSCYSPENTVVYQWDNFAAQPEWFGMLCRGVAPFGR